jgi:hypothetical protein
MSPVIEKRENPSVCNISGKMKLATTKILVAF